MTDMDPRGARAALEWLYDMGADEIVGDLPVNRFAAPPPRPQAPPPTAAVMPQQQPLPMRSPCCAPAAIIDDANAIAAACASLAEIADALSRLEGCALRKTATNLCFSDGNPKARLMLIGEAPGRDEDIQGKPFVGRSGQLLDRMLAAIGLSRQEEDPRKSVLIANVIFWRPPGNRTPTEQETLMCLPFLKRAIELIAPDFLLCAGAVPTQRLTGVADGILRLRGKWLTFASGGRVIPLMPTLHPAYLLRQPAQKRLAWRDLLAVRQALDAH
ncbi:uracil-DNA glycosylase [soil metagenome]